MLLLCVLTVAISIHAADAPVADATQGWSLDGTFREGNGIFAPQQSAILDVTLRLLGAKGSISREMPTLSRNTKADIALTYSDPSAPLVLHVTLTDVSSPETPATIGNFNTQITPAVPLPVPLVTPDKEGVYEVILSVVKPNRSLLNLPRTSASDWQVAEVRQQFVVLAPQATRLSGGWMLSDRKDLLPADLPPADPASRRFLPPLPPPPRVADLPKKITGIATGFPKPATLLRFPPFGRSNSAKSSSQEDDPPRQWHLQLPLSQKYFSEKSERNPDFSALPATEGRSCTWYSLPMETEWGKYYLVEMEYPINVPQSFDVGIVVDGYTTETDFFGNMHAAANVYLAEEIVQDVSAQTSATHQFLFWAETESSKLVLINRQPHQEALFRNVRISRITLPGQQDNQRLPKLLEGTAQRKRIGQLVGDDVLRLAVHHDVDWRGAYWGQSQLINSLHRGGYDGVTLTVLSSNGSLYPTVSDSRNILELLFRRCNSEQLTLIPAIEFDLPIPSLEQLLTQHPELTEEIVIGKPHGGDGGGLQDRKYNVLHPAVQQAMAEIVLDLANRFRHHPSYGGVAIVLAPETYAQLPFAFYPPDDYTFAQFRREMEQQLPFPDEQQLRQTMPMQQYLAQKLTQRMEFLQSDRKIWDTWNRWRAAKVSGFYARLANEMAAKQGEVKQGAIKQGEAKRADAPLYLLGGTMFDQSEIRQFCTPTLPSNAASLQALQLLGFDLRLLSQTESLRFLRPAQISDTKNDGYDGLNSIETVPFFLQSGVLPGVQFVHAATDYFVTTPAHTQSRKRFVRQLAQADVMMFMEGGGSLPFGQESAMFDLLDTYRQLPLVPFQTFQPAAENSPSHQPLTIRYTHLPDKVIVYMVNDAPFAVEADFAFVAGPESAMSELTGHRMIRSFSRTPSGTPSHTWRASLQPYDLLAVSINDPNTTIESVKVDCPLSLCGAEGVLRQKVDELAWRVQTARTMFSSNEMVELQKMLAVADRRCSSGRFSELISLLEEHWAQLLFQQVLAPAPLPAVSTLKPPVTKEVKPPKSPTMYQRMRGWFSF